MDPGLAFPFDEVGERYSKERAPKSTEECGMEPRCSSKLRLVTAGRLDIRNGPIYCGGDRSSPLRRGTIVGVRHERGGAGMRRCSERRGGWRRISPGFERIGASLGVFTNSGGSAGEYDAGTLRMNLRKMGLRPGRLGSSWTFNISRPRYRLKSA
jgi:hypothetical protein